MKPLAGKAVAFAVLTGALAASPHVLAQSSGTTDVRKALDARRIELKAAEDQARAIEEDVDKIRAEREKLTARMLETAAEIQSSESKLTTGEARLAELDLQEKLLRGSLNERYSKIAGLLSALQRMGRNPPPVMITRREDALAMVRSAMLLSAAFPSMRTQATALAEQLNQLVSVMDNIRAENDRLKTENQRLLEMRVRLAGLMEEKKRTLGERRAELERVRTTANEIARSVQDLNGLFDKIDQISQKTEAEARDQEARRKQAAEMAAEAVAAQAAPPAGQVAAAGANTPAPAAPAGGATAAAGSPPAAAATGDQPTVTAMITPPPPAKPNTPPMVVLAPSGAAKVPGSPHRIQSAVEFTKARGKLPMPAQGRRVLSFGDKTQYGSQSKGIVIETRWNGQVTSPCDGWIVYAGEFRAYGQLLIIDAGDGYHVLLAGLSQIDVQPGQSVLAAEPVGTMSGSPKTAPASNQTSGPVLYVEFRKDRDPIDPEPWWASGQQKAQNEQKVQG